jgi:hypothetical protein
VVTKLTFLTPNASKPFQARMEAIFNNAPPLVRKHNLSVKMMTREQIQAVLGKGAMNGGFYKDAVIHILWRQPMEWTIGLFAHELGHACESWSKRIVIDWHLFYQKNVHLMPTEYARGHVSEGFAECFAWWLVPELGRLHPLIKAELDRYNWQDTGPPIQTMKLCPTCNGKGLVPK